MSFTAEKNANGSIIKKYTKLLEPKIFSNSDSDDPGNWIRRYELFARKSNWEDEDKVDLMELYLGNKALTWFERLDKAHLNWAMLKSQFIDKFEGQESELRAWKELQSSVQRENEDIDELALRLDKLFKKAKVDSEKIKFRCLLSSINPKLQKLILKEKINTYQDAIDFVAEDEKVEKICIFESKNVEQEAEKIIAGSMAGRDKDSMYETLVTKFDQLNLNILNLVSNSKIQATYDRINAPRTDRQRQPFCFICKEIGHVSRDCKNNYYNKKNYNENVSGTIAESSNPNQKNSLACIERRVKFFKWKKSMCL
ncbi:hypothetical protein AYI70_g8126 [Smittium culicis]|uniref:CCHC-type domain-containing protein n=1 Tax=Smittium culicis TaxID=133412 RepID=A0A1R1XHG8_9FUNG|nr:hypothetical protein AYI70_g8126 [Smittium culicis]